MKDFATQIGQHTDHLPNVVLMLIALTMIGMFGWALYALTKFILKLIGIPKEKNKIYSESN